jgi:hypothetical protein
MHIINLLINHIVMRYFESRFQSLDSKKDEKFVDGLREC